MAEGFGKKIFPKNIEVISAGTVPADEINPSAIEVMNEVGIDISSQKPKKLTPAMLKNAIAFISMGCGVLDSCPFPLVQGKLLIEDWDLEDPAGQDITIFRQTRYEIEQKIKTLAKKIDTKYS